MLRFLTAGESHGSCLSVIVDGVPALLKLSVKDINRDLKRRQAGYGRGERMAIEEDKVQLNAGVRAGRTTGAPISLVIDNKDWDNWSDVMGIEEISATHPELTRPRPGHADLVGLQKYSLSDVRDVLERASARETAARVAVGAIAKKLLAEIGVSVESCVVNVGGIEAKKTIEKKGDGAVADKSDVRVLDAKADKEIRTAIDRAAKTGETIGGVFETVVLGVPPGLGSYAQWDRRLDGRIARAVMSIPAIKGVEIGDGFKLASTPGSLAHDEIYFNLEKGYYRRTNRAGGLEGGVTNGEPIIISAVMKPIPTLGKPLRTVDVLTKKPETAIKERADFCAVPAASIVAEAMVAATIADAALEKFGGDSVTEFKANHRVYAKGLR